MRRHGQPATFASAPTPQASDSCLLSPPWPPCPFQQGPHARHLGAEPHRPVGAHAARPGQSSGGAAEVGSAGVLLSIPWFCWCAVVELPGRLWASCWLMRQSTCRGPGPAHAPMPTLPAARTSRRPSSPLARAQASHGALSQTRSSTLFRGAAAAAHWLPRCAALLLRRALCRPRRPGGSGQLPGPGQGGAEAAGGGVDNRNAISFVYCLVLHCMPGWTRRG